MKYTHEDEKLNSLIGKEVKIITFDDRAYQGKLQRDDWDKTQYLITYYGGKLVFRKSHIKRVEKF